MKIKVKDCEITLTDFCKFSVIDNKLYNNNTHRYEAVDGDVVEIKINNKIIKDEIIGYTTYQIIPTKNHGTLVLSTSDDSLNYNIIHNTKVYEIKGSI